MNKKWPVFIASRWFKSSKKSSPSLAPSVSGIAVGVAALLCVIGVMNGFQQNFINAVLNLDSYHIQVPGTSASTKTIKSIVPNAVSILPFIDIKTLITTARGSVSGVKIKIIGQDEISKKLSIKDMLEIRAGSFDNGLVIGSELSRRLDLHEGDLVSVLSVSNDIDEGIDAKLLSFTISGIFHSGHYEFDSALTFLSEKFAKELLPKSATFEENCIIGIKISDRYNDAEVLSILENQNVHNAKSWREYNRSFFGALRMEKSVMMMLVGLIFLVVGVNIFHSMSKAVYNRMEDIAVLRAIGSDDKSIRYIFIMEGIAAGSIGALIGLCIGLLITFNINQIFNIISLVVNYITMIILGKQSGFGFFSSSIFYVNNVPVSLAFLETFFITISGAISAILAALFASSRVSKILPLEVLRNE